MKRVLKKLLKFYVYIRLGVSNYLAFMIALFNTASLAWYFLGLKQVISFKYFILLFFALYLPLAAILGYYDLKKLVAKTSFEVTPYWKRPTFFLTRYMLGAISYPLDAKIEMELSRDKRLKECLKRATRNFLKLFLSEGEEVPRSACVCKVALEEGIIDKEYYEMCVKVLEEGE